VYDVPVSHVGITDLSLSSDYSVTGDSSHVGSLYAYLVGSAPPISVQQIGTFNTVSNAYYGQCISFTDTQNVQLDGSWVRFQGPIYGISNINQNVPGIFRTKIAGLFVFSINVTAKTAGGEWSILTFKDGVQIQESVRTGNAPEQWVTLSFTVMVDCVENTAVSFRYTNKSMAQADFRLGSLCIYRIN
jgi:hypothetical protein